MWEWCVGFQFGVGGRVFGGDLSAQITEDQTVPLIIEKILLTIELHGLFVEGIYRKSGSVAQIKQLRKLIETTQGIKNSPTDVHVCKITLLTCYRC